MDDRDLIQETCACITQPSAQHYAIARARLDSLTKPLGSLGRLEDIAAQWVSIRQQQFADPICKAAYVFAADHGIAVEGVSAYPRKVTQQMVLNFVAGDAAINTLTRLHHVTLHIVDVGVDADLSGIAALLHRKVARGTHNMLHAPAMSQAELYRALAIGIELADQAAASGYNLLAIGEMGIGNTTAATAITCAITGASVETATGHGTGIDTAQRTHKISIIEAVLNRHFSDARSTQPLYILRSIGGFEIAAMTGMFLGAARHQIAILCDGFISTAAAVLAFAIEPLAQGYFIASHESSEPGHRMLLAHLKLSPILSFNMRLGEGTGAVLAMPIVESAVTLYTGMATFTSASVDQAIMRMPE